MRAARMYGYKQPLVLEDVVVPDMAADEVLIKVQAAGMCRHGRSTRGWVFHRFHRMKW